MNEIINSIQEVQDEIECQLDGLPLFAGQDETERDLYDALVNASAMLDDAIHILKEVK